MIKTGKNFEDIVTLINNFKSEVQIFSALGLTNINKHSEIFLKRILNLTYNLELENLNKGKSNFPGLDLGDTGDGIAFQITASKKSEKIDDTLTTCLKFKHYESFQTIKVFILTSKQNSYSIKTITEPHFSFLPENNIIDFNDLLKDIEHLDAQSMKAMKDFLNSELQPVIDSIKTNASEEKKHLLDVSQSKLPNYSHWQTTVTIKTENISSPEIYTKLNSFLSSAALKNNYLPIFNNALRTINSHKEVMFLDQFQKTHAINYFYGNGMLLENSSITIEKANYTDGEILSNLLSEMVMLITCIIFFNEQAKSNFEIEIEVFYKTNTKVYFFPKDSLVIENVMSSFILESPFELKTTITNIETSTLADLLQQIIYCFVSKEINHYYQEPFLTIKRDSTEFVINNIKRELGINC